MTDTANSAVPERGVFRRALAGAWAFVQTLESSGLNYTLDRIERLEGEVGRLKEDIRQSRDPEAVAAHNASNAAREH